MPVSIEGKIVRLALNQSSDESALDKWSEEPPVLWQGGSARLGFALFKDDPSAASLVNDWTGVVTIKLYIRKVNAQGTLLVAKTLTLSDVNTSLTYPEWRDDTNGHFTFDLSSSDTNQAVNDVGVLPIYLVVEITTSSRTYVAGFAYGRIVDVGIVSIGPPAPTGFTGIFADADGVVQNDMVLTFPLGLKAPGFAAGIGSGSWPGFYGGANGILPPSHNGFNPLLAFNANFSDGAAEGNIFNTSLSGDGIRLTQKTGTSTYQDLAWFHRTGRLELTPATNAQGFTINQLWSGSSTLPSNFAYNDIQVTDSYNGVAADVFMSVLNIGHTLTGAASGSRSTIQLQLFKVYPLPNEGNDTLSGTFDVHITGASGGTIGTPKGGGTAFSGNVDLNPANSADWWGGVNVGEFNVSVRQGHVRDRTIFHFCDGQYSAVRGSRLDGILSFSGRTGTGWNYAFLFSNVSGNTALKSDSCILGFVDALSLGKPTILHGFDLSGWNVTGSLLKGTYAAISDFGLDVGAGPSTPTTSITAVGGAPNIDLEFHPKGTGWSLFAGNSYTTNTAIVGLALQLNYATASQFLMTDGSKHVVSQTAGQMRTALSVYSIAETDAAISAAAVGLLDDRGNYNASSNLFPSTGGSGASGAVLKGDLWTISVAGTLGGVAVTAGDVVRALVDAPGQTAGNWVVTENNIGYIPVNSAGTLALAGFSAITGTIALTNLGGLGTGVSTFLATPTSANLAAAVTDETGSGSLVFANTPTLVTPVLGVASGTTLSLTGAVGSSALTVTGQTQTTSQPVLNLTQTWNAGGVTFTGLFFNATSTASAAGSLLLDLQRDASSKFKVTKNGDVTTGGLFVTFMSGGDGQIHVTDGSAVQKVSLFTTGINVQSAVVFSWSSTSSDQGTKDLGFARNAAGIMEVNNGTTGQWGSLKAGVRDSGTTSVVAGLTLGHQSTGTPAAGLGIGLLFNLDSTTTADQNAGRIYSAWTTATHATRTSRVAIQAVVSGGSLTDVASFDINSGLTLTGAMTLTGGIITSVNGGPGFTQSNAGASWIKLQDTSAGGKAWRIQSTNVAAGNLGFYNESDSIQGPYITPTGYMVHSLPTRLKGYTVAGLPAGTEGDWAYVTDATAPAYNASLTGGGSVKVPVYYNGVAWVSH